MWTVNNLPWVATQVDIETAGTLTRELWMGYIIGLMYRTNGLRYIGHLVSPNPSLFVRQPDSPMHY